MNSKIRAWTKLGELTGWGREGIDYRYATTNSINRRINSLRYIEVEQEEDRNRRGRAMYEKSIKQKWENDKTRYNTYKLKILQKEMIDIKKRREKKIIIEDQCAICFEKFYINKMSLTISFNDILTLGCDHTFHHSCIRNMLFLYMDDKCPLCRAKFKYKFTACHKIKRRLKKKIIKHISSENNNVEICKLMDLAEFLNEKEIFFSFINNFLNSIRDLPLELFFLMKYCKLDDSTDSSIYLYTEDYHERIKHKDRMAVRCYRVLQRI